jgi:hypothetical protein
MWLISEVQGGESFLLPTLLLDMLLNRVVTYMRYY